MSLQCYWLGIYICAILLYKDRWLAMDALFDVDLELVDGGIVVGGGLVMALQKRGWETTG